MDLPFLLSQLESDQLIRRDVAPDLSYLFKHTLTQETAYGLLLKVRRTELHRRVAGTIEQLFPEQSEQNSAVLAFHYERAGVDGKAFDYAALAGDVARRTFSHAEAIALYDRALAIAARMGDAVPLARVRSVYVNRGNVLEIAGNFSGAEDNYNAMIAFAQRAQDRMMEADGLIHLLTTQGAIGSVPDANRQLGRALELAQQSGDAELIGRAYWNIGLSRRFTDTLHAAESFERALEYARKANLNELVAFALLDLSTALQLSGQWRRSYDYGQQAIEAFRALDIKPMIANALGTHAITLYGRGETERARVAAQEGMQIGLAIENPWGIGYNAFTLLAIEVDAGNFDLAFEHAKSSIESTQFLGVPLFQSFTNLWLGRMYLELDQLDLAESYAESGMNGFNSMNAPVWSTFAPGVLARVLVRRGQIGRARELLDPLWQQGDDPGDRLRGFYLSGPAIAECALAEKRLDFGLDFCNWLLDRYELEEMLNYAGEMRYMRAQLYLAQSMEAKAESDLTHAREFANRADYRTLLWRVDAALARIYERRGDAERAQESRNRARELIQAIAARIPEARFRESFLSQRDAS